VRNLSFPLRYPKAAILNEFKGTESIVQVNYPVWLLNGTTNGNMVELYVDGLMGEIFYERDGDLRRTKGIRSLVTLSSVERKIVSFLTKSGYSTMDKITAATRLLQNDAHRIIKNLMGKGLVTGDGYTFRPAKISIPHNLLKTGMSIKPEESVMQGKIVNFNIDRRIVEKIGELFGITAESMKIVYCPYWLLVYGNRKVLVDGLGKKIDVEATKEVMGVFR